jgi:short-subunit dehydrogenase
MSDFLKNPLSLFDVKGKVAVITGASGAFGALAAQILAASGCKLVLTAGKKAELDAITKTCTEAGAEVEALARSIFLSSPPARTTSPRSPTCRRSVFWT